MARIGEPLENGTTFPDMTWNLLDGSSINIGKKLQGQWAVVCLMRGHW